jgi:hypothetical protein
MFLMRSRGCLLMISTPISAPAGFAPAYAVGYSDINGQLALVTEATPLPVATFAPAPAALAGQASVTDLVGPFEPTPRRVIMVTLDGDWSGTVRLLRSTDGGLTKLPLRVGGATWGEYTVSGCEQAWSEAEEGTSFYLDITLSSGTVAYRVSQ